MKIYLYERHLSAVDLKRKYKLKSRFYCLYIPNKNIKEEDLTLEKLADKLIPFLPTVDNAIAHPNIVTEPPNDINSRIIYDEEIRLSKSRNYKNLSNKSLDKLCNNIVKKRTHYLKESRKTRKKVSKSLMKR